MIIYHRSNSVCLFIIEREGEDEEELARLFPHTIDFSLFFSFLSGLDIFLPPPTSKDRHCCGWSMVHIVRAATR